MSLYAVGSLSMHTLAFSKALWTSSHPDMDCFNVSLVPFHIFIYPSVFLWLLSASILFCAWYFLHTLCLWRLRERLLRKSARATNEAWFKAIDLSQSYPCGKTRSASVVTRAAYMILASAALALWKEKNIKLMVLRTCVCQCTITIAYCRFGLISVLPSNNFTCGIFTKILGYLFFARKIKCF